MAPRRVRFDFSGTLCRVIVGDWKGAADAEVARVVGGSTSADSNPAFLELRKLEVEARRIEKWNGQYPQHYWSTAEINGLGIIIIWRVKDEQRSRSR